ncbi:MAG: hypothetical protein ACKV2V_05300 [Blastocatellia bacterium]
MKALLLCVLLLLLGATTSAQGTEPEDHLKKLTPQEQAELGKQGSPNDRVKASLRIGAARLQAMRMLIEQGKSQEIPAQILVYEALIRDTGKFLAGSVKSRDKAHKTMELGLKEHIKLLESLRRDVSFDDGGEAIERARQTADRVRVQSLAAALGDDQIIKRPEGSQ